MALESLFLASLGLNAGVLGVLALILLRPGGRSTLKSLLVRKGRSGHSSTAVKAITSTFDILPRPADRPVVFAGDSLTSHGHWAELLSDLTPATTPILNRGIGGDTSPGLLARIDQIIGLNPTAVFIMIGTNDAGELGLRAEATSRNITEIVQCLTAREDIIVYVQSILPTASPKFNAWSSEVNLKISKLDNGSSVRYVDLRPTFLRDGVLNPEFTLDGVHLTGAGYEKWKAQVEYLVRDIAAMSARRSKGRAAVTAG